MRRKNKMSQTYFHGYIIGDYYNEFNNVIYKEGQDLYVVDILGDKYILENLDIVDRKLVRRIKHGKKNNSKK